MSIRFRAFLSAAILAASGAVLMAAAATADVSNVGLAKSDLRVGDQQIAMNAADR